MRNIIASLRLITLWSESVRKIELVVFLFLVLACSICEVRASGLPKVYISEIAWMGGFESGNDEWIEICNSRDEEVD